MNSVVAAAQSALSRMISGKGMSGKHKGTQKVLLPFTNEQFGLLLHLVPPLQAICKYNSSKGTFTAFVKDPRLLDRVLGPDWNLHQIPDGHKNQGCGVKVFAPYVIKYQFIVPEGEVNLLSILPSFGVAHNNLGCGILFNSQSTVSNTDWSKFSSHLFTFGAHAPYVLDIAHAAQANQIHPDSAEPISHDDDTSESVNAGSAQVGSFNVPNSSLLFQS